MITEIYEELAKWTTENGIHPLKQPEIDLQKISEINAKKLEEMDNLAYEDLLLQISSFNLFLKSLKNSIEAQIKVNEARYNDLMGGETMKLPDTYNFKTGDEKQSVVRKTHLEINKLFNDLTVLRAKFVRIKDIPYGIDKKIELIKLKYKRKLDAGQFRQS